jgi:hypothetical protein
MNSCMSNHTINSVQYGFILLISIHVFIVYIAHPAQLQQDPAQSRQEFISYHEFIYMKSYYEFSVREFILLFSMYVNSYFIWNHSAYEFIYVWIHSCRVWIHTCRYMNSYTLWIHIPMNSYHKLWIHSGHYEFIPTKNPDAGQKPPSPGPASGMGMLQLATWAGPARPSPARAWPETRLWPAHHREWQQARHLQSRRAPEAGSSWGSGRRQGPQGEPSTSLTKAVLRHAWSL